MILRIPGFPPGIHTDSAGTTREFTAQQLLACAAIYSPASHEAPLVIGHPDDNEQLPQGWITRLEYEQERLTAYADKLSGDMFEMLRNNQARKYSFSFYLENHPSNPVPGALYLRHVGIVPIPAIKDNPPAEMIFSDGGESLTVNFSEGVIMAVETEKVAEKTPDFSEQISAINQQKDELTAREKALQAREDAANRREISAFCETLEVAGKVLPKDRAGLEAYLATQKPQQATVSFAESGVTKTVDATEWLRGFLSGLPRQVEFAELSRADGAKKEPPEDETAKQAKERLAEMKGKK
jgi:hypothetical protein